MKIAFWRGGLDGAGWGQSCKAILTAIDVRSPWRAYHGLLGAVCGADDVKIPRSTVANEIHVSQKQLFIFHCTGRINYVHGGCPARMSSGGDGSSLDCGGGQAFDDHGETVYAQLACTVAARDADTPNRSYCEGM